MSEHGGHFGLLVGNWPVGSKLEGGEVCKQTDYDGPTLRGKGLSYLVPRGCWASRKALMGSEQSLRSTQQVTELPQGTGALGTVSWPRQHWHPDSCRVLGVVLPLWAQIPTEEPGRHFNSFFALLWLSPDIGGPNKGVKTVELLVICANSVLESKRITQSFWCEPIKLGNTYLLKCR